MNSILGLRASRNTEDANYASIGQHWVSQDHWTRITFERLRCYVKSRMWLPSDLNHALLSPISVKSNKLRCWKHNFGRKSVGGCSLMRHSSLIWPDTVNFFHQNFAQMMTHKPCQISARCSAATSEKNSWGLHPSPLARNSYSDYSWHDFDPVIDPPSHTVEWLDIWEHLFQMSLGSVFSVEPSWGSKCKKRYFYIWPDIDLN